MPVNGFINYAKNTRLTFPFLGTTWVSQYQKGKTVPESNETRDDNIRGWQ